MAREIKFKVYNEKTKEKYYIPLIELMQDREDCFSDWIISEYTGLKDKNGVEIYEGDIVEHAYKKLAVVVFQYGKFEPENHYDSFYDGWNEDVTVIDNVYENPELLEIKE